VPALVGDKLAGADGAAWGVTLGAGLIAYLAGEHSRARLLHILHRSGVLGMIALSAIVPACLYNMGAVLLTGSNAIGVATVVGPADPALMMRGIAVYGVGYPLLLAGFVKWRWLRLAGGSGSILALAPMAIYLLIVAAFLLILVTSAGLQTSRGGSRRAPAGYYYDLASDVEADRLWRE
jgi:hypothetical protein